MRAFVVALCLSLAGPLAGGQAAFTAPPKASRDGAGARVSFAVSGPTDVEVAVLDAGGRAVRHLAAGVLGGEKPPPAPLKAGLAQALTWDGKDDFGRQAAGGPFTVRVRAGTGVTFGRFIGGDPYTFGSLAGIAADEDGNVYLLGFHGVLNQQHIVATRGAIFQPVYVTEH